MVPLGLLLLIVLAVILAPRITRYDPNTQELTEALLPPSVRHFFGTDQYGRDIYTRVLYGGRISLRVGLISTGIALAMGLPLGVLSAYYMGVFDAAIMRLVDVLLSFPPILLALAIMVIIGPGLSNVMLAVGIAILPDYIRITRASSLSIKHREYTMASRAFGASGMHIMVRHIIPNVFTSLLVLTSLDIAGAILFAAGLSFLGLGAQPPTAEWGAMLTGGRDFMREGWWLTIFPGLAIMISVLSINLIGDGLRDALDPRYTRRM